MDNDVKSLGIFVRQYLTLILIWLGAGVGVGLADNVPMGLAVNLLFFILVLPFLCYITAVYTVADHPKLALFVVSPGVLVSEVLALLPVKLFKEAQKRCLAKQMMALVRVEEFDDAEKIAARLARLHGAEITEEARTVLDYVNSTIARSRGDWTFAEEKARKAIAFYMKASPFPAEVVAGLYSELGVGLARQGKESEAFEACQRAIGLVEREQRKTARVVFGMAQNNFGFAQNLCGNLDQAQKYYQQSRETKAEVFGPDGWQVGMAEVNLASVAIEAGNYAAAGRHAAIGEGILKTKSGIRKVVMAGLAAVQGEVERESGRLDEAKGHFDKALKIYAKAPEKGDLDDLHVYLGRFYAQTGDKAQAAKYFTLARDFRLKEYGAEHYRTLKTIAELQNCSP
jgi:tetratricopeptide (TPR) repeat protein